MRIGTLLLCTATLGGGVVFAQDIELQVELTCQVSTTSSRRGDAVSAAVLSPAALSGDVLEGKVTQVRSGAKMGGQSVLTMNFDTLRHGSTAVPINTQLRSATNSKGRANVDDEGRVVKRGTGNVVKTGAGAGVGGLIGGLAGGRTGAVVGAAAGGLTTAILVDIAADAPNITFLPGSRMVLAARSRGGQSLASLSPSNGAPPAAASAAIASAAAPAPAAGPAPAATAAAPAAAEPVAAAPAATQASAGSAQPDLTAVKSEFIPGDKVLLVDDFSDMAGDEPPPHWKVRGGTAELRKGEGIRQLTFTARRSDITPNITGLPKNFTMEMDLVFSGHDNAVEWRFPKKPSGDAMRLRFASVYTKLAVLCSTGTETLTSQLIPMDWTKPVKTALWLQNGRLRLYVNGERLMDANQIQFPELGAPFAFIGVSQDPKVPKLLGIQYARIAESTPDFSQVIMSSGRYVSYGILFDTDSDRLKPESGPTIKMIARGIETNANLKLRIEGHTDSVGNANHNLDLSRRRAEAVKAVLVSQFKIDGARLTADGLGATKPVDSNDTAQGRAQNRRVEFVRAQ
ncbi:MAG: OmpA family protein [Bryobacterales bacterium]|nr:OmpA family protein [Bryobacterales bacterium]